VTKTVRIQNEEPFRYKNYDKLMNIAIGLEIIGLVILFIALLFLVVDALYNPNTAIVLVVVGLCFGIPAALGLLYLIFRRREQRKMQVEQLYQGEDINTVIGDTNDEELAQNLQLIREAQLQEQQRIEEEKAQLEQEISILHTEIDEKKSEVIDDVDEKEEDVVDDLEEERARLLEQREQLEKDKAESEAFAKHQLESALLGKGQLDIMQAEKVRVAMLLAEKEKKDQERDLRAKQYAETRKECQLVKKTLLARPNLETLVRKYYVEVAACFLMNRDAYKDEFGLAPYNKIIQPKPGCEVMTAQHVMAKTEDRFWRFAQTLVDVERFMAHPVLFPAYEKFVATDTSLVIISEQLHYMYLQKNTRKDFVKNYTYKEDFENLLILVNNNYIVRSGGLNPTNWEKLGFNSFDEAMHIASISANTAGKTPKELVDAVLKKRQTRAKK